MKYILLLLSLNCTSALAGMYLSEVDAKEGLRLGLGQSTEHSFAQGVGQVGIRFSSEDGTSIECVSNGVLLTPQKLLCAGHIFEGDPQIASVIFYPDAQRVLEAIARATKKGKDPKKAILKDGTTNIAVIDVMTNLNLSSLNRHPKYDLAIIDLIRPLDKVPILSLVLDRPLAIPTTGYLASFSSVIASDADKPMAVLQRHVSVLDVEEEKIVPPSDTFPETCFVKTCEVEFSGEESRKMVYVIDDKAPKLFAYPLPGDSGAPFIIPGLGVIGLNYGLDIYEKDGVSHARIVVIPLHVAKDWITAQ